MQGLPAHNPSQLEQGTAHKHSVGLENEEDIFVRVWGCERITSLQGGDFKLTIAMAPSHEVYQDQHKKLLKFAINEIQAFLKWCMWV
jgi:hypothetical protein